MLVWFERYERMDEAIIPEEQIESGSRKDKLDLIERDNPLWTIQAAAGLYDLWVASLMLAMTRSIWPP
jgi:putative endonuclease